MNADSMDRLATAFATALVQRMAWRDWPQTQDELARLLSGHSPELAGRLDDQLRRDAMRLVYAGAEEQSGIRQVLTPVWREHLLGLLREHPAAEAEVRSLLERLGPQEDQHSKTMINVSTGTHNRVFAVQNGAMTIHESPSPPPERS
jgi:hypothetical protein